MFDLHTHTLLSDGVLLPSELARRYEIEGYTAIAITDHVDASNIKTVVPAIVEFCKKWPKNRIKIFSGIELTHIPLEQFKELSRYARKKGIKVIVAHGQSPVEPVIEGTNATALKSDINILAHPGKISKDDVLLAKKRGIFLEITNRKGHKTTNRHVVKMALKYGAKLILNSDSHSPYDIPSEAKKLQNARLAGLKQKDIKKINLETQKFLDNI